MEQTVIFHDGDVFVIEAFGKHHVYRVWVGGNNEMPAIDLEPAGPRGGSRRTIRIVGAPLGVLGGG